VAGGVEGGVVTWKEIKEAIEAGGVADDMELWYIDISFEGELAVEPQTEEKPNDIGFTVTN
jgi:hypothetical protein